ncbi:MAG: diguanylate cyclase, partial [Gammaproteobacteria bacterium]|nr:diguanylate cyclase [Gammaproteobacteria bacterium]
LALRDPQYPRGVGHFADKLVAAMAHPFHIGGKQLHSGISLGACAWPLHGDDRAALLGCADAAMYRIKQRGGNGIEIQPVEAGSH